VAAVGASMLRFVGRRTGAGTSRRTAATTLASALPWVPSLESPIRCSPEQVLGSVACGAGPEGAERRP